MTSTKQFFLLRHAKSSWEDPGLDDHERPLERRGRRASEALRQYLHAGGIEPALVLCSSARRARETLEGVRPGGEHLIEPGLYAADAGTILERLRNVPEEVPSVMVIGHNPALQMAVLRLANEPTVGAGESLAEVRRKFPTGALASLEFAGRWRELGPGAARLTGLVRPKQLLAQ